ncbi:hypothetical protein [Burkholderia sp. WSM2232]|uniref:hypothetical protein n=1 Tax=Burkholderia sp. WSM2232 TaxID=944436 RepID=UPI000480364A|nr:hypothetical protein [Burkholderia sp. WSM2232]
MEFDSDWLTLGRHRVCLRSPGGFPTESMRTAVDVIRIAIENNMSARARLVDVAVREEQSYDISVGTTFAEDRLCAPQLESAIATVLGLLPAQVRIFVTVVTQEEVDLHFGVYERMLAEKIGGLPPIRRNGDARSAQLDTLTS